ncbi:alkyl sulfatase C-terminal domain-containing protein [Streptomyces microflavus]|uniref:alkyl sulfatase C-terminal domain-containing protein n=1 Tax=Streptomyces microflavus TaxID=1919 RepID=UPI003828CF15
MIDLVVTGPARSRHRLTLHNGALTHRSNDRTDQVDGVDRSGSRAQAGLTLTLTKPQLLSVLAGGGLDGIEQSGDASLLGDLFAVLAEPDKSFPIMTP